MNSTNYILKNGHVFLETGLQKCDIHVCDGKIVKLGEDLSGAEVIDCTNKIISPGFIDVHVHLREPGFEHKEDIQHGTHAAIRGGYTTIFAMPNTNPVMDNVKTIEAFNKAIKAKGYCEVKTFAALSHGLKGETLTDVEALAKLNIAGFSDDGKGLQNDEMMQKQMKRIKAVNHLVSIHCEDESELSNPIGCVNAGEVSQRLGLTGINNASESNMLKRDLMLNETVNLDYHMCHISTRESVELIRTYQKQGMSVSAEVSPHHLCLNETHISVKDPMFKMNPPLRSTKDQAALIQALNDGVITIIATDHAPHADFEKAAGIEQAPFGIIGLEQALSVLNTYLIQTKQVKLETILNALTYAPAKRFGLKRNFEIGSEANIAIIDLEKERLYNRFTTVSKATNTPFHNMILKGHVVYTIIGNTMHDWRNYE